MDILRRRYCLDSRSTDHCDHNRLSELGMEQIVLRPALFLAFSRACLRPLHGCAVLHCASDGTTLRSRPARGFDSGIGIFWVVTCVSRSLRSMKTGRDKARMADFYGVAYLNETFHPC